MEKALEIIEKTRKILLGSLENLSLAQLNEIPAGFNNNIVWNAAHLVATLNGVCYLRAGLELRIEQSYFDAYKPGSKPEQPVDEAQLAEIKRLLVSSVEQLKIDYDNGFFAMYTPWTTRYGVKISTIEEAIGFLPFHEGMHLGYILAQRHVIS